MDEAYREAIRAHELAPLTDPEIDAPPLQMNEPFAFTARIPILAPVHLGDYKAVQVEKPTVEVNDEDIDKVVRNLREEQTTWAPVPRPAQVGDRVTADLKLMVGEKTISDLKDNEFELADTREGIFTGMDEHLIGLSEGDEKAFTTTIPEGYTNTDLAGQEAHYTVAIKGVKVREIPEIDDELAKSSGDYETLDGLRAAIREELTDRRKSNARRDFREAVVKAVTDQATVEIHPVLIKGEASDMTSEFKRLLERNGLDFKTYLTSVNKTEAEYQQEIEPEALAKVKRDLVIDAIADAEGVQVSEDEVQNWVQFYNTVSGGKPLQLSQLSAGQRAAVASRIRRDKVTDQLATAAGWVDEHSEHEDDEAGEHAASEHPVDAAAGDEEANAAHAARAAAALDGEAAAPADAPNESAAVSDVAATPTDEVAPSDEVATAPDAGA
jgi:trigger factor